MNGWSNKETWLVNLWLGDYLCELQEDGAMIDADFIEQEVFDLVDDLKLHATNQLNANGLLADLLNCALAEINYSELGEHYDDDS